jgi:hypothetical protein
MTSRGGLASVIDSLSDIDGGGRSGRHAGELVEGRLRYWPAPDALHTGATHAISRSALAGPF